MVNLYYFNPNYDERKNNMKKRKLFIKAVSLVMAIIMTMAVVPLQAISLQQENADMLNETVHGTVLMKVGAVLFIKVERKISISRYGSYRTGRIKNF